MDTKIDDKMVRQIEKNLSNNINDNLFSTGRILENNRLPMGTDPSDTKDIGKEQEAADNFFGRRYRMNTKSEDTMVRQGKEQEAADTDYPLVSYDYISTVPMAMSRAEYIRQAREACLRQLSNTQIYSRPYDVNYMEPVLTGEEALADKKDNAWKLFHDDQTAGAREENSPQEIAAYRSLIIRTICAVVLFLSVFIIDKFEIRIGKLNPDIIQEYVTGNDTLKSLEDIVVTWLK